MFLFQLVKIREAQQSVDEIITRDQNKCTALFFVNCKKTGQNALLNIAITYT